MFDPGSNWARTYCFSFPDIDHFEFESVPDAATKQAYRDMIVEVICTRRNKNRNRYVPYCAAIHDLTDPDNIKSLDKVMSDYSVAEILRRYYLNEDNNEMDCYRRLVDDRPEHEHGFFTRNLNTGRYCDVAVRQFGFPNDVLETEN